MSTAVMDAPPAPAAGVGLFARHFQQLVFETHVWDGKRQAAAVSATLRGEAIDADRCGKPRVSLLLPDLERQIRQARQRVYDVLNRHTVTCDAAGARLVSVKHSAAFVAEFNDAVAAFDATADLVASRHGEIAAHNYDYWRPRFSDDADYEREIGRLVPPAKALRAAFSVHYRLTAPDAAKSARFEDSAVAEFFGEAAKNAAAHQQEMIEALVKEPVARLAESLGALKLQLTAGKKVTPGSFTAVTEAIALCRACADVIPAAVMERVKGVALQITGVVDKAEHAKNGGGNYTDAIKPFAATLTEAFDGVIAACDNHDDQEEIIARYGRMPRALEYLDEGDED